MVRNANRDSVQIQAGTERGFGPGSDPIIITTDEDVPSGAPVEIQVSFSNQTQCKKTLLFYFKGITHHFRLYFLRQHPC